jgi:outer membrane protein assembly factor BamB
VRWEYGLTTRALFTPSQTPSRIWVATDDKIYLGLSKINKQTEALGATSDRLAASPAQVGTIAYVPLMDGTVLAVDLDLGNIQSGLVVSWRVNLGGLLNRTPLVTKDAVFLSGDNAGVARVNRANGQVIWRTEPAADRMIGVNQDFVYVRDRQGRLLIYDAVRATDPTSQRAIPLTSMNLAEFNIPVVNTVSDRVYLAADNGLIVCVRDASPKYAAPLRMAPAASVNPLPTNRVPGAKDAPKDPMTPIDGMPKDKDGAMPKDKDAPDPKKMN